MRVLTISPSSSVALPSRHIAAAVSPTKHGVFGITLINFTLSPTASCNTICIYSCFAKLGTGWDCWVLGYRVKIPANFDFQRGEVCPMPKFMHCHVYASIHHKQMLTVMSWHEFWEILHVTFDESGRRRRQFLGSLWCSLWARDCYCRRWYMIILQIGQSSYRQTDQNVKCSLVCISLKDISHQKYLHCC